jgi:lipopolysaccharide/colanic/teichoic acid biosynthesis glycosyltransferase
LLATIRGRRSLLSPTSDRERHDSSVLRRFVDVVGAGFLTVLLSPVLAGLAAGIRFTMGSPIFFRQLRPGYKGQPFEVVKFRTMKDAVDANGNPLPDEERLTRLGIFMRQLSLDELPQLWNILRGDMSFIGPRPLLMEFLKWYSPEQMRRHDVKPGVTGWAQVQGRHAILFSKRLELDVWYVENRSLGLDLKILGLTLLKVLSMRGAEPAQTDAEVDDVGLHDAVRRERGLS